MTLLLAWVVFPVVLAAAAFGFGCLVELASGARLPGPLRLPAGFAAIIVLGDLTTSMAATARFTVPAVVVGSVGGVVLGLRRRRWFPEPWLAGSAIVVYLAYAAPVVLTGTATFAGYIKLDDTATWLAPVDRTPEHGRSLAGIAPSTYLATLKAYLGAGYPVGSMVPLGA